MVWNKNNARLLKGVKLARGLTRKKWQKMTFFVKITTLEVWNHFFTIIFVLSSPLKITSFQSFLNFTGFSTSQKYILQNKKVSVESDNNFWRYRSHRFENTVSRKTRLKFYVSAEWPVVAHAFAATQMPITSGILRISKNPFKHVFLKGWTFEKWNEKNRFLDRNLPLRGVFILKNRKWAQTKNCLILLLRSPTHLHSFKKFGTFR